MIATGLAVGQEDQGVGASQFSPPFSKRVRAERAASADDQGRFVRGDNAAEHGKVAEGAAADDSESRHAATIQVRKTVSRLALVSRMRFSFGGFGP